MATILPFPMPTPAMPQRSEQVVHNVPGRTPDPDDTWSALMVRAQDGDKVAYHALLNDITPYLRAIAGRYLGRGEDAEDAVQEILLVVHDIRHTYEPGRPFKPWLGTIATRRCIDLLRRRSRRIEHELLVDVEFDHLQDASPGPEEATTRLQEAQDVRDAVAELSPRQQEAVRLMHLQDMSLNEASVQSKQSVGSLKVACHRALKTLKHALHKGDGRHD
ncbi:RNA polymerase sigma factor [Pseudoxanthomonas japonensis]|uniref:RNA polymerase sigma factor n=1 Tax=Pseudoxanthomonas japonensis TaxID=69284 RepID=UPI0037486733